MDVPSLANDLDLHTCASASVGRIIFVCVCVWAGEKDDSHKTINLALNPRRRVSRSALCDWARPVFDRMAAIVEAALTRAGITAEAIDVCEVVGGGARVPEVQAVLTKLLKVRAVSDVLDLTQSQRRRKSLAIWTVLLPLPRVQRWWQRQRTESQLH